MKNYSICDSRYPGLKITNDLFLRQDPFDIFEGFLGFDPFREAQGRSPAVDVKESPEAYLIEAELPGLSEKDVKLEVKNHVLSLAVESKPKAQEEAAPEASAETWIRRERRSFAFSRSFTLPENADEEKIEARFKDGLLAIAVPKKPEMAPRAVPVKVA